MKLVRHVLSRKATGNLCRWQLVSELTVNPCVCGAAWAGGEDSRTGKTNAEKVIK